MTATGIIIFLIVGGIAGWLAGLLMKGRGFGIVGNIIVGVVGAVAAGYLLPMAGILIGAGIVGQIINAFIGAVIVLAIISLIKRA